MLDGAGALQRGASALQALALVVREGVQQGELQLGGGPDRLFLGAPQRPTLGAHREARAGVEHLAARVDHRLLAGRGGRCRLLRGEHEVEVRSEQVLGQRGGLAARGAVHRAAAAVGEVGKLLGARLAALRVPLEGLHQRSGDAAVDVVREARLGEPDDVVVLVLGAGDVAGFLGHGCSFRSVGCPSTLTRGMRDESTPSAIWVPAG